MKTNVFFFLLCVLQISLHAQNARQTADTIVTGTIVTMDAARSIYDDGAVAIAGDTILAVGPRVEIEARYQAPN